MADGTTTWTIDPARTAVELSIKRMMFSTVRGRFTEVEGTIEVDEGDPERSSVRVDIGTASVDTGTGARDDHLRSRDFLDVKNHPTITFRSKRLEGAAFEEGEGFRVVGDLTIRGTTREVVLDARFEGKGRGPEGRQRAGFAARTTIDRRKWGLEWNQALETGGILIGHDVKIELDVHVVKQEEGAGIA